MPTVRLDAVDAFELSEVLRFINNWLASDHDRLDASLRRFVGHPDPTVYHLGHLRRDLARFTFLLGGDDGEDLFDLG